jgi:glycosyltransferase involved in cell wall biosynthesis
LKKVLIITYYWPPFGGSGVQRWLKFTKYLREFGYEPVIYTPENPEFMAEDRSLCSEIPAGVEVIKRKITEPYSLYRLFTGKKKGAIKPGFISSPGSGSFGVSLKERLSLFIRSNVFIPDPKVLWVLPSVKFLKKHLLENPVDAIISTGPPHSMHLIAQKVSLATGIPWLADFRDPWTKIYNFKYLRHTPYVKGVHEKLERSVVRGANAVVTVTNTIASELKELGQERVFVVTNGFDQDDFKGREPEAEINFTLTYTGLFVQTQNPSVLWRVLGERAKKSKIFARDLRIRLIGNIDKSILEDIYKNGLRDNLILMDYMPHNQVILWQRKARILLLSGGREPESKGIMTGKFFEYLAAGRAILGFGPKGGDMDIALEESGAGKMFDFEDKRGVVEWIDEAYRLYKDGSPNIKGAHIDKYSRKNLTGQIARLLDEITAGQ